MFLSLKRSVWLFSPITRYITLMSVLDEVSREILTQTHTTWRKQFNMLEEYSLQAQDEKEDGLILMQYRKPCHHIAQWQQESVGQENSYVTLNLVH